MIDVKDISTLVGRRVVNQDGQLGTIAATREDEYYPIFVIFDSHRDLTQKLGYSTNIVMGRI